MGARRKVIEGAFDRAAQREVFDADPLPRFDAACSVETPAFDAGNLFFKPAQRDQLFSKHSSPPPIQSAAQRIRLGNRRGAETSNARQVDQKRLRRSRYALSDGTSSQ